MTPSDSTSATTSSSTEFPLSAGQKLAGCYLLRQQFDTGGANTVWLAQDEVLGRDISLHFLPSQIRNDARAMEEIRKEVKRNRQLIHPNILRVHDLIEEPEFTAISMDLIAGRSLASTLKEKGTLDAGGIQPWIGALCQTLEDAHKINLTHRDLAPSNIYVGSDGKVMIAGFGISRCVQDALGRVTRGANPRLSYLSPQGADGQPAARTDDVYSLGMLLFELLTGELPFTGGDVLSQIKRVAAPRVSARLAASRRASDIPASWDETIAASLRKDASQRPATALEFVAKLEKVAVKAAASEEKSATEPKKDDASRSSVVPPTTASEKREEPGKPEKAAATETKPAGTTPKSGAVSSEPPPRKAVEILRERAAELARNKASGNTPAPSPAPASTTPTPPPVPADTKAEALPAKQDAATETYPSLYPKRSRGPALALAAGLAIAAIAGAGYYLRDTKESAPTEADEAELATTPTSYASEIRSVNHQSELPPEEAPKPAATIAKPAPVAAPVKPDPAPPEKPVEVKPVAAAPPAPKPSPAAATPAPVAAKPPTPAPSEAEPVSATSPAPMVAAAATATATPEPILIAANKPGTRKSESAAKPAPAPAAAESAPPAPEAIAEKSAALEKLKAALQTSEQAQAGMLKQQEQMDAAIADLQKLIDQKTKELAPMRKSADDLQKTRKQREDAQKTAELEAQKAQQLAAEKARLAEEARKALADLDAQNEEKLAAQKKADAEIATLRTTLTEKQQAAATAAKAASEAKLARNQQQAAVEAAERELQQTKLAVAKSMAAETARKAREEAEKLVAEKAKERQRIETEIAAMKKMFEEKMKVLEDAQKAISDAEAKTKDTEGMQKKAVEDALKLLDNPAPSGGAKPASSEKAPAPAPTVPPAAGVLVPSDNPLEVAGTAATAVPAATLAMKTETKSLPITAAPSTTKPAQGANLQENSLGMKFVPVGDVQFAIWQTRVKDFEIFAKAVDLRSNAWKGPGFKQGPDHPVVNVTWHEAVAFCKWLTEKERKDGSLPASQLYRLPSDLEWSKAVGLGEETGRNPEARDMGVPDVYPWGTQWPPPASAGNYTGEETGSDVAIKGYDDGFAWTSPVGSFPPNQLGLYDLGGNVWQWVMDSWNSESKHKVLRGASWYNGALKLSLLSSCRVHAAPDSSTDNYGFRIVRASDSGKSSR